jgi:hypothetical protein
MSNFSKKNIFSELENESPNYVFPKHIKIIDKQKDEFMSNFLPQTGGSWNKKPTKPSTDDEINQLIAMLTSDSDDKNNFTANTTETDVLENRLKNMVQGGGSNKRNNVQKGGADPAKIKEACDILANAGLSFTIKNKKCEEYVQDNSPTSTFSNLFTSNNLSFLRKHGNNEISPASFTGSDTSSYRDSNYGEPDSPTSAFSKIFASQKEIKKLSGNLQSPSSSASDTSSVLLSRKENLSPTSINASVTSVVSGSKSPSSVISGITSTVKRSDNMPLSPTSTDVNNKEPSLFDVAATFISTTAKKITNAFNDSVTPEGVTSSPSNTVKPKSASPKPASPKSASPKSASPKPASPVSATSSVKSSEIEQLYNNRFGSSTSEMPKSPKSPQSEIQNKGLQIGGAKKSKSKAKSKKISKKKSKKASKNKSKKASKNKSKSKK